MMDQSEVDAQQHHDAIHDERRMLKAEIASLSHQNTCLSAELVAYDEHMARMQADSEKYLIPDNECGIHWFVSRMLWHLDGPEQRALANSARDCQPSEGDSTDCVDSPNRGTRDAMSIAAQVVREIDCQHRPLACEAARRLVLQHERLSAILKTAERMACSGMADRTKAGNEILDLLEPGDE